DLPAGGDDAVAGPVRRVRVDAHLLGQRQHGVLVGADERAAHVDGGPALAGDRPHAAADAVTRLDDDDLLARLCQPPRRGEPGVAGADDADVGLDAGHSAWAATSRMWAV